MCYLSGQASFPLTVTRGALWFGANGATTAPLPSVQIKDVPESTHAVLRHRAAAAHQSLQEYLSSRLIAEASQPTLEEVLDRAGGRSGGSVSLANAVKTVHRIVLVVDASVLAVALADDGPAGDAARARLRGKTLAAPELGDLEVASVLRRQGRAGLVDDRRSTLALTDLEALPMRRAAHLPLLARCSDLRDNLTTCEAAYVALAEALNATLLTGDRRLARAAGPTCTIELLRAPG